MIDRPGDMGRSAPDLGRTRRSIPHAHKVLELRQVLEAVAARTTSAAGRARILARRPTSDVALAREALSQVEAARSLADRSEYRGVPEVPPAEDDLRALSVRGTVLGATPLHHVLVLLQSAEALAGALNDPPPALAWLRERLFVERRLASLLVGTVDADGGVLDRASPELARLRREIQKASAAVVRALEKYVATLPDTHRVDDASVTVRGGRYVIAIRREGRSQVGGIVHDESASGATLFVEPPDQVDRMNRLRRMEGEERREVARILADRTEQIRPHQASLEASLDALVEFDALAACAGAANAWSAHLPSLVEVGVGPLSIVGGRHPLLIERGIDPVPFDLTLGLGERIVIVSGPNTGGKTVLLKSVGLIPLLAQCGILPPVGPKTCLPVFDAFFADIGDEQSIQDDLSTFSGHIANVSKILSAATSTSLVLLDELGTGTDPSEGAALARAILEALEHRGTLTIATSHLGALKRIADDSEAVVNASLQFDAERVEPTYRLIKGRPGRSFGIQIAKRLELPDALVDRALELLDETELRADGLLARLEQDEKQTRELLDRLERERAEAKTLLEQVTGREADLRQREKTSDKRAREEARRLLLEARAEVDRAIEEGRRAAGVAEAERAARRAVEHAASQVGPSPDLESSVQDPPKISASHVIVGSRVQMKSGAKGVVVELEGQRASVELDGGVRMQVAPAQLKVVTNAGDRPKRGKSQWVGPTGTVLHEVDLRGLRVDEVESVLSPAIDRAMLSDLPTLRIIHGMGTGAVRARVGELIEADSRVGESRLGERGEGGAGVTVITLR